MNLLDFFKERWGLLVLISIPLFIIIRTKIRGFFFRNKKTGEELSFKGFFKMWGKGIEGITPLQQAKSNLLGVWIVLTGLISGIIVNCLVRLKDTWWWLTIILVGSLFLTLIQTVGFYQKYKILKRVNEEVKKLNQEVEDGTSREEDNNQETI